MRRNTERRLRIAVAERAGCTEPGEVGVTACAYCGAFVVVSWDASDRPRFEYRTATGYECAHLDHVVPEWANGPTSPDNTVIACVPCNIRKGGRPFGDPDFLAWLAVRRDVVRQEERAYDAALRGQYAARVAAGVYDDTEVPF